MSYFACTRVCVCTFICSLQGCMSLFLRLRFLCMFYVLHFQVVINSLTPTRPQSFALLLFASLCSHFVWNLRSLIISAHFLSIAHSLPHSPHLPLPLLVKCATSATLFCPSLGTLARAGQWILMSSFGAHSVKAKHRDLWIPRLHWHSQSNTLTCCITHILCSPLSPSQVKDCDNCQVTEKIIRQICWWGQKFTCF